MKQYVIALDQGTTSSRAIIFDRDQNIVEIAQREFTQIFPQPGWVEHDAQEIWATQLTVAQTAMEKLGITAQEVASQNRLTVTVKVTFENRKYPDDNFSRTFSAYSDFDATQSLDAVQDGLCTEIIDKIVEDVFNASVAQW